MDNEEKDFRDMTQQEQTLYIMRLRSNREHKARAEGFFSLVVVVICLVIALSLI